MAIVIVSDKLWEQIKDKPNPLLLPNWELEHEVYSPPGRGVVMVLTPIQGFRDYEQAVLMYTRDEDGGYRLLSIHHLSPLQKLPINLSEE